MPVIPGFGMMGHENGEFGDPVSKNKPSKKSVFWQQNHAAGAVWDRTRFDFLLPSSSRPQRSAQTQRPHHQFGRHWWGRCFPVSSLSGQTSDRPLDSAELGTLSQGSFAVLSDLTFHLLTFLPCSSLSLEGGGISLCSDSRTLCGPEVFMAAHQV